MNYPICSKCHKPLTDPVSIALGMGPECRGGSSGKSHKMTKRQTHRVHCIERAVSFSKSEPITVGNETYYRKEEGWTRNDKWYSSDEDFKKWLERYGMADFKSLAIIQANREEVPA